jgi:hypothetical protein
MDQSKKTMRHFYCRDVLWETFEQMANDFDCSIDYLVNEAMRAYAKSKNYQTGGPTTVPPSPPQAAASTAPAGGGPPPPPGAPRPRTTLPPPPPVSASAAAAAAASVDSAESRKPPAPPPRPTRPTPAPPVTPGSGPNPRPTADAGGTPGPTVYLVFNGQRISIDQDQFVIGRGSKVSDLPIKDGNISRKHAAVIRRNGVFYIKDLGSTNGIDYKGLRIDNKRIDEGDVFHICDYELRFTYR